MTTSIIKRSHGNLIELIQNILAGTEDAVNDPISHSTPIRTGIRQFTDISIIASGGFGVVFRGHHLLDDCNYAIKMIPIRLDPNLELQPQILSKIREIRYLAKLDHPHIIRYHTSWVDLCNDREDVENLIEHLHQNDPDASTSSSIECLSSDQSSSTELAQSSEVPPHYVVVYLQMERMEYTLDEWIRKETPHTATVYRVILGVLRGIQYLHHANPSIIHCDLKPKNILVKAYEGEWIAKLADFGLASVLNDPWRPSTEEGTFLYKAPEMSGGESPTPATDMYSLGVLLYELTLSYTTEMERLERIREFKQGGVKTGTILDRMISHEPVERPSINEVIVYIQSI